MIAPSVSRSNVRAFVPLERRRFVRLALVCLTWGFALVASPTGTSAERSFPTPFNTEHDTTTSRLSAVETAETLKLPPGFKATVFAGEPDVQNPIAMAWDALGRLWVVENYTYAERPVMFDLHLRDRILVFEDKNGDGHFSSRRVFTDEVQRCTSVEVGHGGVWVMCPPQLLFFPDRDGDAVADGPPEVVLDGFTVSADKNHTVANGLRFGPDGWLYGRCGQTSPGDIGLPGTPFAERLPLRGSLWRYHPLRRVVEVINSGTSNPWGHDWNAHGELFFINTVIGHLWHSITGAHYQRNGGLTLEPNLAAYELIEQHADHYHWNTGESWDAVRKLGVTAASSSFGGGHAHSGLMIYQGDNWPAQYQGRLYTLNFHGRRMNEDYLERSGSGYVGRHVGDFFTTMDPWFRGVDLNYGPDGGVFLLDWSDTGECHDETGVHRLSGRVYKIVYGQAKAPVISDLTKLGALELVDLHTHKSEWFVRKARLELAGRAADGRGVGEAVSALRRLFDSHPDVVVKLRALWTLYCIGATNQDFLRAQLSHENENIRTWAIRLLTDTWPIDTVMSQRPARAEVAPDPAILEDLIQMARADRSALVRLAFASVLQRLALEHREALALALVAHQEDAGDHNLPLLIWYGLIPLAEQDAAGLGRIAAACELPATRRLIARRLVEILELDSLPVRSLLAEALRKSPEFQGDIVVGLADGLRGLRKAQKPESWDALAAGLSKTESPIVRDRFRDLTVLFGDGRSIDELRRVALDSKASIIARETALRTLISASPPDLRQLCEGLLRVRSLNVIAVEGMAKFDDLEAGRSIAKSYASIDPIKRETVIQVLLTRRAFVQALLAEIADGGIPRKVLTPFNARMIRSLGDDALTADLTKVWGESREPAADKRHLIETLKAELTPEKLELANKSNGRVVFNNLCAACHTLYGNGGHIGPDLTGSGRSDIDFLLLNTVDPSANLAADFRMNVITLKDGRTLSGTVLGSTPRTLTLQGMVDRVTVEKSDIVSRHELTQSMMPEGLLESLAADHRRDLIAYLLHPTQVPMPDESSAGK